MPEETPVFFDKNARGRIKAAVRSYEGGVDTPVGHIARPEFPEFNIRLGKTNGAILEGATGTVDVYSGTTAGSETITTESYSAYNRFGDIDDGRWVLIIRLMGNWHIIAAQC